MKSLKNATSISQIKEDTLLGITNQPPNTCPLINVLIFNSERSSINYEIDLSFNPEDLYLTLQDLDDRVEQLHQWATDVSCLYDNIDKNLIQEWELEELNELYLEIEYKLSNDYMDNIKEKAKKINSIITDWERLYDSYIEEEKNLEEENNKKSEYELELEDLDSDDENYVNNKYDLKDKLERSEIDINQIEKEISRIQTKFKHNVEYNFEDLTSEFSSKLEQLRSNNDDMRSSSHALKKALIKYVSNTVNLVQPMDYLKKFETGEDGEISLGIIDKNNIFMAYSKIGQYLFEKKVVNHVQRDVISKIRDIESLVEMVNSLGYNTVRYYTSEEGYIRNPEIYIEKNIKNKQGNNYKIIPKI